MNKFSEKFKHKNLHNHAMYTWLQNLSYLISKRSFEGLGANLDECFSLARLEVTGVPPLPVSKQANSSNVEDG